MRITFDYKEFIELTTVAANVLKLDKKLNTETRLMTLVIPASKGLTDIKVYANTHSIQSVLDLKGECDSTEEKILELNLKRIQEIITSFGKTAEYQPDKITFQHDKDSFRYIIYLARNLDNNEAENFVFTMPYSHPQTYYIEEIDKSIQPVNANNKWTTLGVRKELTGQETQEELQKLLEEEQKNPIHYLNKQLTALIPLFKYSGVHINNTPYIQFSAQKIYMQTLSTLSLYDNQKGTHSGLTAFKLPEDPCLLLHSLTRSGELTFYNEEERANLLIKTKRGIYILNYRTSLFDYRETLKLVKDTDYVKVNRLDFVTKIQRLKLADGRTECSFVLNEKTNKWELNLRNSFSEQDIRVLEVEGLKHEELRFNLVTNIIDEVITPIVTSQAEHLYIYFDCTPEGVWTLKFKDSDMLSQTYMSIQTFKEHSFKSMKLLY